MSFEANPDSANCRDGEIGVSSRIARVLLDMITVVVFVSAMASCRKERQIRFSTPELPKYVDSSSSSSFREQVYCVVSMAQWRTEASRLMKRQRLAYFAALLDAQRRSWEMAALGLKSVLNLGSVNSRQYLQLWYYLRMLGEFPDNEESANVIGVVVESYRGYGVAAVYRDGTIIARIPFCGYERGNISTERMRIWQDGIWELAEIEARNTIVKTNNMPKPPKMVDAGIVVTLLTAGGNIVLRNYGKEDAQFITAIWQWVRGATRELLTEKTNSCAQ